MDSNTSRIHYTVTKSAVCLDLISHTTEKKNCGETYCTVAGENDLAYGSSNELKKNRLQFSGKSDSVLLIFGLFFPFAILVIIKTYLLFYQAIEGKN